MCGQSSKGYLESVQPGLRSFVHLYLTQISGCHWKASRANFYLVRKILVCEINKVLGQQPLYVAKWTRKLMAPCSSTGNSAKRFSFVPTNAKPASLVVLERTLSSRPIRRTVWRAARRLSIRCPALRREGERSTMMGWKPARVRKKARTEPAFPAPETRTVG